MVDEVGVDAFTYLTAPGLDDLREQLAARGRKVGFASQAEEIIVTSGAQQAIDLTVRGLLEHGDVVAVESPTYSGLLSVLRAAGARVIGVPVDDDGLDVDALEELVGRHEVKLVALQTGCQNPTGCDLSDERRERLAALARERNLMVLEDGVYGDLRFDRAEPRALRALAPAHVVYVDSLSKTVGGGLRVGWIAARGPVYERLAMLKLESDFHSPTLTQHIAARYLAGDAYAEHLKHTTPIYQRRRDSLLEALERHLPGEIHAPVPHGGHHVWATLSACRRRAHALHRGDPPRGVVRARRRGVDRAADADVDAAVVLDAPSRRGRGGHQAPGPRPARGAPPGTRPVSAMTFS